MSGKCLITFGPRPMAAAVIGREKQNMHMVTPRTKVKVTFLTLKQFDLLLSFVYTYDH